MGVTWRGREHKEFIANHLSLYSQHATDGTLKLFWPDFFNKWFDKWPLPEPAPDAVVKAGSLQEAIRADRVKKIKVSILRPLNALARTHRLNSKSNAPSKVLQMTTRQVAERTSVSKITCPEDARRFKCIWPSTTTRESEAPLSSDGTNLGSQT